MSGHSNTQTPEQFSLVIDAFTPATLPMARLAEYLREFAALLGSEGSVHFEGVSHGSAVLASRSEPTASRKIRNRLDDVLLHRAPKSAMRAYANIDNLLADDNAIGQVRQGPAQIIEFPGRRRANAEKTGPVRRHGNLDGQIFQIGGRDETINIHLREGEQSHRCEASIALARRLAPHLLDGKVRLFGEGDWLRTDTGWTLVRFTATDFVVLDQATFRKTLKTVNGIFDGIEIDTGEMLATLRHG